MFSSAGQCTDPDSAEHPPTPLIEDRGVGQARFELFVGR